jgi:hypothetical protein
MELLGAVCYFASHKNLEKIMFTNFVVGCVFIVFLSVSSFAEKPGAVHQIIVQGATLIDYGPSLEETPILVETHSVRMIEFFQYKVKFSIKPR